MKLSKSSRKDFEDKMSGKKSIARIALILLAMLLLSSVFASAATLPDFFERGLRSVNYFLAQGKNSPYMKVIDFVFFALLFVSIYTMGAVYAFKDFKRAEKMIAILLGVMTAFLLVLAKISVGVLLPYVHWIFYVLLFSLIYWILKGVQKKFWRFLLALLLTLFVVWLANALTQGFGAGRFDLSLALGFEGLPPGVMSLLYALLFLVLFSFIFWMMGKIGMQNNIAKFIIALLLGLYLAWLLSNLIGGLTFDLGGIKSPTEGLTNPFAGITKSFTKIKSPFQKIDFSKITERFKTPEPPQPTLGELSTVSTPKEGQPEAKPPPTKEKPEIIGDKKFYIGKDGKPKVEIDGDEYDVIQGKEGLEIEEWGPNTKLTPEEADSLRKIMPSKFEVIGGTKPDSVAAKKTKEGGVPGYAYALVLGSLAVLSPFVFKAIKKFRSPRLPLPLPNGDIPGGSAEPIDLATRDVKDLMSRKKETIDEIEFIKNEKQEKIEDIKATIAEEMERLRKGGEGAGVFRMDPDSPIYQLVGEERKQVGKFLKSGTAMREPLENIQKIEGGNIEKADRLARAIEEGVSDSPELQAHAKAAKKAAAALKRSIEGKSKKPEGEA